MSLAAMAFAVLVAVGPVVGLVLALRQLKPASRWPSRLLGLALAAAVVTIGYLEISIRGELREQREQAARLRARLDEKRETHELVEGFKADNRELERRVELIKSIAASRCRLGSLVETVASIPEGRIEVAAVRCEYNEFEIYAHAGTEAGADAFAARLRELPHVTITGLAEEPAEEPGRWAAVVTGTVAPEVAGPRERSP